MERRHHRIKAHFGIGDYHKFFLKENDCEISRADFGSILKDYNGFIRDNISKRGLPYNLPSRMGVIELRKKKAGVSVNEDGSIKNTMAIDWRRTRQLWEESAEAREKKIKRRFVNEHSDGFVFKIAYLRSDALYANKTIYRLRLNRLMKRQLSKSIINKSIDAFVNKY